MTQTYTPPNPNKSARFEDDFVREQDGTKITLRFFDWRITAFYASIETGDIITDIEGDLMTMLPIIDNLEESGFKKIATYHLCEICDTPKRLSYNLNRKDLDYNSRLRIATYEHNKVFHPEIAATTRGLPKLRLYKNGKFQRWIKFQEADQYSTSGEFEVKSGNNSDLWTWNPDTRYYERK